MNGTYPGLYRGVVEDGVDPALRGRVRVSVPDVLATTSSWAERCVDRPGPVDALAAGTAVWVQFENGDADYPVVVGCAPGFQEP